MIEFICKLCGKHYIRDKFHIGAGYCSQECGWRSKRGIPRSEETKRKISLAQKGIPKSPEARRNLRIAFARPERSIKISLSTSGSKNHGWKGGRYITGEGYAVISKPNHPYCNSNGYIPEHRLIAEGVLGRYLKRTEIVHHINRKRDDNRNENLIICQNENYHKFLHHRMRAR